jgi:nitrite reductase/ring-hydroxylating ferredoxin subunit
MKMTMASKKEPKLLKIAAVKDLKEGHSLKFEIPRKDRKSEAFIVKKNGKFYSYLNLCRHWTVGLDFDDNDFFSEDKEWLVCKNHGAIYEPATGICSGGPCGGAALYRVPLIEKEEVLYADVAKVDWGEM